MSNTYKVAGITVHNGVSKVRFTDDMIRRIKQFTKGGATRCEFIELPSEMTKMEALEYLKNHQLFQSAEDQATINDAIIDRQEKTPKREPKPKSEVKVKKTKQDVKPSLDTIKAKAKSKKESVSAEQILDEIKEEVSDN
jgi:hypothetical protein